MFFELYWQYFVAGLFAYVLARVGYVIVKGSEKKCSDGNNSKDEDFKTPDESKNPFLLFFLSLILFVNIFYVMTFIFILKWTAISQHTMILFY